MTQRGYSLIEMLVAISISTVLVLAISGFAVNSVVGSNQDYNKTLVLTNAKEASGIVARQIRLAKSVLSSNAVPDTNAPTSGNPFSWSGTSGTGSSLILAVPAHDSSGNIIWQDTGSHTLPYTDNVIFYLDSSTKRLYKRTLADTTAPGNATVTTCPPAAATASCPADADVVDDIANISTSYIKSDGSVVDASDPNNITGTEAVNYTVTETRIINGKSFSGTYTTMATLRNR